MLEWLVNSGRGVHLCLAATAGFVFATLLFLQTGGGQVLVWRYFPSSSSSSSNSSDDMGGEVVGVDIVIWKPPHHPPSSGRLERLHSIEKGMKAQPCFESCRVRVSSEQWEVDGADAVVFFMFMDGFKPEELPMRSRLDQIWVYNQHEPPPNFSPGPHLNSKFNWSRTYRLDSEVYQPYYRRVEAEGHSSINSSWLQGKTGMACAVISNCNTTSKRKLVIEGLQKAGLEVDVFGACGTKGGCGRKETCTDFWTALASKYKYFLAFENSLCVDYITEKFWRPLQLGMVPVVLGRGKYSQVAPPKSYVDLRDFESPEELVGFLQRVEGNDEEYAGYYQWRESFRIVSNTDHFCQLCKKLKEYKLGESPSHSPSLLTYSNLTGWWGTEAGGRGPACLPPEKIGLGRFLK